MKSKKPKVGRPKEKSTKVKGFWVELEPDVERVISKKAKAKKTSRKRYVEGLCIEDSEKKD